MKNIIDIIEVVFTFTHPNFINAIIVDRIGMFRNTIKSTEIKYP